MKKNLSFLCLTLFFLADLQLTAQVPPLQWAKQIGGTQADLAHHVATDSAGNVYFTGTIEGPGMVDLDPGPGTQNYQIVGENDMFIVKLDPSGSLIWAKAIGGTKSEYPRALQVTPSGSVYIAGGFDSPDTDFDPSSATFTMDAGSGDDGFIMKMDPAGNFLWAGQIGGLPGQINSLDQLYINDIALSGTSVYITGLFEGDADLSPGAGISSTASETATANGSSDIFLITVTEQGNFVNFMQIGGSAREVARSIEVDPSGNIQLSGDFVGYTDLDPSSASYTTDSGTSSAAFTMKITPAGSLLWVRNTLGTGNSNYGDQVLDAAGNIYVLGSFFGTIDADPGPDTVMFTTTGFMGKTDITVTKLDASGNTQWISRFGDNDEADAARAIILGGDGKLYISGDFEGDQADFDPGAGTHILSSKGADDAFVMQLNTDGTLGWILQLGADGYENARDIAADAHDNILVTGNFSSDNLDFDHGPGTTVYSASGNDGFIMKLGDQCSALVAGVLPINNGLVATIPDAGYQWYDCIYGGIITSQNSMTFTPDQDGSYAVIIALNGCIDTSDCLGFIRNGIHETASLSSFEIWPNPSNGTFNIRAANPATIEIYNAHGQLLKRAELQEDNRSSITLSGLANGVYLLRSDDGTVKRLVIDR